MRITDEQLAFLKGFKCKRLSSFTFSKDWLDSFTNDKNETSRGLVDNLKNNGVSEDIKGHIAYYIVISPDDRPCFYFSLQCGSVFDFPFDEEEHKRKIKNDKSTLHSYANNVSISGSFPVFQWVKTISKRITNRKALLYNYQNDHQIEAGRNVFRVDNLYSSVELVHFCLNLDSGIDWSLFGPRHTVGEVIFWYFVVPTVERLHDVAGCKYLHLFAADQSEEEKLINYYTVSLNFRREIKLGVTKPSYDFNCAFLCQEIVDLVKRREEYFNDFNVDPGEVVA